MATTLSVAPSAADYFGYGDARGGAVMPYGLGSVGLPPAAAPATAGSALSHFAPAPSFWRSAGAGLFLLLVFLWYFDVRLVNR